MRHGVALNYDYVDLPSDIGTSGPENQLPASRAGRAYFCALCDIILPVRWVAVLGPNMQLIETDVIAIDGYWFATSKKRHGVGRADVAFLSTESPT